MKRANYLFMFVGLLFLQGCLPDSLNPVASGPKPPNAQEVEAFLDAYGLKYGSVNDYADFRNVRVKILQEREQDGHKGWVVQLTVDAKPLPGVNRKPSSNEVINVFSYRMGKDLRLALIDGEVPTSR